MLASVRAPARSLLAACRPRSRLPATAQACPGLNGYVAYGSNRTGSQFSDDIYVSPLDVEAPTRSPSAAPTTASPRGRRTARLAFKTRSSAATSSRSSTPTARTRRC
jgi:hypothetical protein